MSVLFVTGTGTGVGKTIATAALAAAAIGQGLAVTVCKPVQTGIADGDDDLAETVRLAGPVTTVPGWRYPEAVAPVLAARRAAAALPTRAELLELIRAADRPGGLTLVEGAGGALVALGAGGTTLRDLAAALGAPAVVVTGAGLGTLNHTALTLEALAAHRVPGAGLIVGSWPADPSIAETDNRAELAALAPVRGVLPGGASGARDFPALAAAAIDAGWVRTLVHGGAG